MSNTTNSELDLTYAMPESIANVLGSAGFAEAARAFQYNNIGGVVPVAMRHQLSLAASQRVVTPDDIDNEITEMILRIGNASDPAVNEARAVLQGLVGKPIGDLKAAAARLETLTAYGQNRQGNDAETPEERINRLWAQIDKAEESILEKMRRKLANGEISQDQFDEWYGQYQFAQEQQEFARSLPEGDPRREAANVAAAQATGTANDTASRYLGNDDQDIRVVRDNVEQVQDAFSGYQQDRANLDNYRSATPDSSTPPVAAYNPEANAPTLLDIPEAVATAQVPANNSQPAVVTANAVPAEQPYEIADISLGESGQFTPASTGQPVVSTGGRGVA